MMALTRDGWIVIYAAVCAAIMLGGGWLICRDDFDPRAWLARLTWKAADATEALRHLRLAHAPALAAGPAQAHAPQAPVEPDRLDALIAAFAESAREPSWVDDLIGRVMAAEYDPGSGQLVMSGG